MTEYRSDLVVLGGGSAGYAAAIRATELGLTVTLIERDRVGGTCLHRGCIPTKALLHQGEVADAVASAGALGVEATVTSLDAAAMRRWRENIVAKKYKGLQGLLTTRGVTVATGEGRLSDGPAVVVGDDRYVGTDVLVATGSYTRTLPGLSWGGRVIDSEGALALEEIPTHAIVLGGGVIGVEFASAWRSLGADVTIIEALDRLVPAEEPSSSKALERAFRKRGIVAKTGVRFSSVTQDENGVRVALEDGGEIAGDVLLVAVGRGPATADIGLEDLGVATERGFVSVDERLQTTAAHIWAAGDVVAGLQLAHRGFQQGIFVAEQIAGKAPVAVPEQMIPRVVYSHPELASVGMTEAQAREIHGDRVAVYDYNLAGNAKSEILGTAGSAKVIRVVDGPVIGVHLVGDRVGELITEGQLAVAWEAHPEDLAPLIHTHPSQSEALGEAFLALAGKPLHSL